MISAKIIADSVSTFGDRITTYELEYPRFIHAEFMTHRQFSRNAASSRAIPVKTAIKLIEENTAMPIHWGKNQPGMSAKEECTEDLTNVLEIGKENPWPTLSREQGWEAARDNAIYVAKKFEEAGYHKQIVNRILEPFSHIKVVCTATEYDNFFYLRRHPDAQPEIQELAEQMWAARERCQPTRITGDSWHVPYYGVGLWSCESSDVELADAIAISASCCAQVSYRKSDDSLEKARMIYARLVDSKPVHASPFEHQATPIIYPSDRGVTHFGSEDIAWSGNFKGWIQNRQLIPGHTN